MKIIRFKVKMKEKEEKNSKLELEVHEDVSCIFSKSQLRNSARSDSIKRLSIYPVYLTSTPATPQLHIL